MPIAWQIFLEDSRRLLDLRHTLSNGQAFSWKLVGGGGGGVNIWKGVLSANPILLRHNGHGIEYALRSIDTALPAIAKSSKRRRNESSNASTLLPKTVDPVKEELLSYFQISLSPSDSSSSASSSSGSSSSSFSSLSSSSSSQALGSREAPEISRLYAPWSLADPRMKIICDGLPGMRILRQDPWECLISFICSSNNNIARISQMIARLRISYGTLLIPTKEADALEGLQVEIAVGDKSKAASSPATAAIASNSSAIDEDEMEEEAEDDAKGGTEKGAATTVSASESGIPASAAIPLEEEYDGTLYSFPSIDKVASIEEGELRRLGFGYRAKFVIQAAKQVQALGGHAWLLSLRSLPRDVVSEQLMKLAGVGPKVADCVALFSLAQSGVIPVDTHVWNIAVRYFDPSLAECKSLTPKVYERVGELFRGKFGDHAGWAHSLLFAAELPHLSASLPQQFQDDMKAIRASEKLASAESKKAAKERRLEKKLLAAGSSNTSATTISITTAASATTAAAAAAAAAATTATSVASSTTSVAAPASTSNSASAGTAATTTAAKKGTGSTSKRKRGKQEEGGADKILSATGKSATPPPPPPTSMAATASSNSAATDASVAPKRKRSKKALSATTGLL